MARAAKSVIIVDADLRRATLHKIFQVPNQVGLTGLLLQEKPDLEGSLQETEIENLRVLTSGPLPPNPAELLDSQKMHQLVELLQQEADFVIFDTPPCLPVTDAVILSLQVDGVLMVIRSGHTRRAAVKQAAADLAQGGARVLGIVLNRVSPGWSKGYDYYYYAEEGDEHPRRRRSRWYQRIPLLGQLFSG